jgi:hypothetical protein
VVSASPRFPRSSISGKASRFVSQIVRERGKRGNTWRMGGSSILSVCELGLEGSSNVLRSSHISRGAGSTCALKAIVDMLADSVPGLLDCGRLENRDGGKPMPPVKPFVLPGNEACDPA